MQFFSSKFPNDLLIIIHLIEINIKIKGREIVSNICASCNKKSNTLKSNRGTYNGL